MRPFGGRLLDGAGHPFRTAELVAHCLLVETGAGLVLVDTGLGTHCVRRPQAALGRGFLLTSRPVLDLAETALHQVRALGYDPGDVRHIVLTHLDLDHAGGLTDFPQAKVHVHRPELEAALAPRTTRERHRYRQGHWAHGPDWQTYWITEGEHWLGFEAVRGLTGLPEDILLIPLAGHTRGHTGVALRAGDRWLLHAGDAFFFHAEAGPGRVHCPPGLRAFQSLVQMNGTARHHNQARLAELAGRHGGEVAIVCAHDPRTLRRFAIT